MTVVASGNRAVSANERKTNVVQGGEGETAAEDRGGTSEGTG